MADGLDDLIAAALGGSSGGGGSSGETFGPIRYEPSIGKYVQDGSRGTIRVVGGPVSQEPARDPSGYDPSTGLPYGVTRVSTTVSPTGLVYQGVPVNPDGSRYAGSTSQVANYTGIKEGPGGLYGLNDKTGQYELIPGSETLGKAVAAGPSSISSGSVHSYTPSRDYVAEAAAKAAIQIGQLQAEAAAQQERDAAQAALQREMLELQQGFTGEQNALSRAFQAAQQAWQGNVTNLQLQQQHEAANRAAANDFRSAASDTDPIAFAALMKGWGNLENAIRGGETAVTDRALGGAAGLLDLIRRPFNPIPGFTWNEPTGTFVPNATAGGATGATGGGAISGTPTGGATGGAIQSAYDTAFGNTMASLTPSALWRLEGDVWVNRETGETERAMPGLDYNGPFNRGYSNLGGPASPFGNYGGSEYTLGGSKFVHTGLQSVDPSQPDWRPPYEGYNIPGFTYNWETMQNEPTQAATNPYTPVNTPLTVPGLARGGMARGAFIVGDSPSGKPTGHEEMVIAPQGAHVIPLNKMGAGRMMRGGLARYATGTVYDDPNSPFYQMDFATMSQQAPETFLPFGASVTSPIQQPAPVWDEAAFYNSFQQPTTTTGGSGTTTAAAPSSPVPSSGSSVSSTTAPPVVATNTVNTAAVPTTPAPSTTNTTATPAAPAPASTTVGGLVNYGGQQITPEYQALLDEIRQFRTDPTQNTYDRTLNPMDVSFNNLDPISQEVFYRGRQAEFGVPVLAQQWEQNRFRLPGLSRGQINIGY